MLDSVTKRRIDDARNTLVGIVPDPKSQVEQITIALIYKFMDDMDAESEELGGVRKFFTGDYAKYGWSQIMKPGLGGQETLNLYAEGIAKMPENPGIPPLFRDIFKNAYLPYRNPATLKSFLKIINEFTYDHSERLGDAFEYLLSVLGSQGNAGQFRTPRHIIDFIVEIVNPQKNEVVLDPACGTAGFLISAYKHILKVNKDANGVSTLTPDERERLVTNFKGYDISPDMVRLSLVNLYLHGFPEPHIYDYDTLTSEERWNDRADVILANPPFMSPKGGIKPHKRFSIQANRSEVLFTDYIAEHLTPTGRAGIIVPEGIIFQSQKSYTELRKTLVENSLVAVISLPAGVFQPYSGVKTSILILDKSLAKQAETVAFFKVENDGYGLGAQRRAVAGEQLTMVQAELAAYLQALRNGESTDTFPMAHSLVITKAKIAANRDYNLSGERYRDGKVNQSTFPLVPLDEVFSNISNGVNVTQVDERAKYRVTRIQTISDASVDLEKTKFTNDEVKPESFLKSGDILLSHINSFDHLGKSAIFLGLDEDVIHGVNLIRFVPDCSRVEPRYAIQVFKTTHFIEVVKSFAQKAVNQASVKTSDLRAIQIPLPTLEVQKEIVAEIEGYQKVISGARAVLDNYQPHITVRAEWPMVVLGDVAKTSSGGTPLSGMAAYYDAGTIPWIRSGEVAQGQVFHSEAFITEAGLKNSSAKIFPQNTVLVAMYGATAGQVGILRVEAATNQAVCGITPNAQLLPDFLYLFLKINKQSLIRLAGGGAQPNISQKIIREFELSLPPHVAQQAIVAEIEAEQALVAANRELITRFERKIQATLARVWGEEDTEAMTADADVPATAVSSNAATPTTDAATPTSTTGTMRDLYNRLSKAGIDKTYTRKYLLPADWKDTLAKNRDRYIQGALTIARHAGLNPDTILDPSAPVSYLRQPVPKFKRHKDADEDKSRFAVAVVRQAAQLAAMATPKPYVPIPKHAAEIRQQIIARSPGAITLEKLLEWCWEQGIPVLHLSHLPPHKPQAMVLRTAGRPVIAVCENQKHDAWLSFLIAHEITHIAEGHLPEDDDFLLDDDSFGSMEKEEKEANAGACEILTGDAKSRFRLASSIPALNLARQAKDFGAKNGIDPGAILLNIPFHQPEYRSLVMSALNYLDAKPDAPAKVRERMEAQLDWNALPEDSAEFLRKIASLG